MVKSSQGSVNIRPGGEGERQSTQHTIDYIKQQEGGVNHHTGETLHHNLEKQYQSKEIQNEECERYHRREETLYQDLKEKRDQLEETASKQRERLYHQQETVYQDLLQETPSKKRETLNQEQKERQYYQPEEIPYIKLGETVPQEAEATSYEQVEILQPTRKNIGTSVFFLQQLYNITFHHVCVESGRKILAYQKGCCGKLQTSVVCEIPGLGFCIWIACKWIG